MHCLGSAIFVLVDGAARCVLVQGTEILRHLKIILDELDKAVVRFDGKRFRLQLNSAHLPRRGLHFPRKLRLGFLERSPGSLKTDCTIWNSVLHQTETRVLCAREVNFVIFSPMHALLFLTRGDYIVSFKLLSYILQKTGSRPLRSRLDRPVLCVKLNMRRVGLGTTWQYMRRVFSRHIPGSQMSWNKPGKCRARTYGIKSLHFIDSAKSPSCLNR